MDETALSKLENQISVIIPIGDWANFVLRAIESVEKQGMVVGEILLIDNAHSHADNDILAQIDTNNKIRIIKSDRLQDAARARNIGIDNAKGEFIAVLDSDDEYHDNHLNHAVKMLANSKADFYCCAYINKNDKGFSEIRSPDLHVSVSLLLEQSNIGHSTVVYRRNLNFRYPEIGRRHDLAAWLTLFASQPKYICNFDANVTRHKRPHSLSSTNIFSLLVKQIWVSYKFSYLGFTETSFRIIRMLFKTSYKRLLRKLRTLSKPSKS